MDSVQVKGCCPLDCQDSCAWVADVEDGRVMRIAGAADHPITAGMLCAKVRDYEQRLYAPDRLLHPLLRTGPKGSGEFRRISWDEAIARIAERFSKIIAEHGGEALLPYNYIGAMGVVQRRALMRLFHALGASRFHGGICGASGAALTAEGHPLGFDPEEIPDSRLVVLWGANLLTTAPHQWQFIKAARARHGARVICIDPRRTRTAQASDEHISIRPGTDPILAAGLAHIWFAEDLVDQAYAEAAATDFHDFRAQVAPWTPDRVAASCGILPEKIVSLAREIAAAKPAVIRAGVAPQQTEDGEAFVRILSALAVIGGHWRHRGGGLMFDARPVFYADHAGRPDLLEQPTRSLDMARLGETLTDRSLAPPIQGLMIWGANPAVTQPDGLTLRSGLARADLFTVVIEHFMTGTAQFADIVLPSTTQFEHFDVQGAWGHHYISANHPAVAPLGEARSHGAILRALATAMGLTHPALHETDEQIAAAALPDGVDFSALKEAGWIKRSPPRPQPGAGPKLRLCGGVPEPAPQTPDGLLQLLTPKGHFFLNTTFANMPRQRRSMGDPVLEISREDAAARQLSDGQMVEIVTAAQSLRLRLKIVDGMHRGVVALPGKWWAAASGASVNDLAPPAWSPAGQPAYNQIFVALRASV